MTHGNPADEPAEGPGDAPFPDAEIVPAGTPLDAGTGGGLTRWLEQAHRDATANRAQARDLSRTLEGVRESHEYLGKALRKEQKKGRYLVAVALLAPVLAGLLVWGVWHRTDGVRQEIDGRLGDVATAQDELRQGQVDLERRDVAQAYDVQIGALEKELGRVRRDLALAQTNLTSTHSVLNSERSASATREAELRAQITAFEREREELRALRAQSATLKTRVGAETARADRLEREIRALESQLGAARARAAAERSPAVAPPLPPVGALPTAADPGGVPSPGPLPPDGAARRPADMDRIRGELNRLLALSPGNVRYTVDKLGGVEGDRLRDLAISVRDRQGRATRTLEAQEAGVTVQRDAGQVLVVLEDGHMLLGGHRAPFFDGRYSFVVDAEPEAWSISSLTCLRFE